MESYSASAGEDINEFISQFEALAILKSWDDSQKKVAISLYLKGAAALFYRSIVGECNDYGDLVNKLRSEFGVFTDYLSIFFNTSQKDENPLEYYYKMLDLATKAKIQDDNIIVMQYLRTIKPHFRCKLEGTVYNSKEELKKIIVQLQRLYEQPALVPMALKVDGFGEPEGSLTKGREFTPPARNVYEKSRMRGPYTSTYRSFPRSFGGQRQNENVDRPSTSATDGRANNNIGRYDLRSTAQRAAQQEHPNGMRRQAL